MGLEPTTFCMARVGGHGKRSRPFAPFRARSLKPPVCSDYGSGERTAANLTERRLQPLQPL